MVRRSVYQGNIEVYSTSAKFPDYYFVWKWIGQGYIPQFKTRNFENLVDLPKVDFKLHRGDIDEFFQEENRFFQEDSK